MLAFINTPITKEQFSANIKAHHDSDKIIKGTYWENGKGCVVGCQFYPFAKTTDDLHKFGEANTNVPKQLYELEDTIFEGLSNGKAKDWPLRFDAALKEGKDYSKVWNHFALWLLIDPEVGVIRYADEHGKVAIKTVADLHQKEINGKPEAAAAWAAARDAAWAAAGAAARDAAARDAAAGAAARDAAWAAAWAAARDAAWAAARDAVRDAAVGAAVGAAARDAAWAAAWGTAGTAAGAAARDAAWAAAWGTAGTATRDATRDAAWAAVGAVAGAAVRGAAGASAWAATWVAAGGVAYERMADKLIKLMENV